MHDDIEDGDDQRYGEDTLHVAHGVAVALNIGDFLLGEGYRLIADSDAPAEVKAEMLSIAAAGHRTLSLGQGAELVWTRKPAPLTPVEVIDIFRKKTAPAFEVALQLGAHLGGADVETHEVLSKYSEALGIAYQVRDDLDDHSGESDSNDLEDARPSLILAIAHKRAEEGAERNLITSLFSRTPRTASGRDEVRRILEERGVLDKAEDLLEAYKEEAVRSLRFLSNATLKGLLRRVVGKIFGENLIEGYCKEFEAKNAGARVAVKPARPE